MAQSLKIAHRLNGQNILPRSWNGPIRPSLFLVAVGVFTLSWDRVGNVSVGSSNLKVSALAFVFALIMSFAPGASITSSVIRRISGLGAVILMMLLFASLLSEHIPEALIQCLRILVGALIPFWATVKCVRSRDDIVYLLTWLVRGMLVAAAFGFYQLMAGYVGLPQLVDNTSLSGGVGRIAAFSYEPASFGQMVLMAIAALFACSMIQQRPISKFALFVLIVALVLTNSRALFLTIPAFVALARPWSLSKRGATYLLFFGLAIGYLLLVVSLVAPSVLGFISSQMASIFDPNEVSSNARRLSQYAISSDLVSRHWLVGLGPGNLFYSVQAMNQNVFDGDAFNKVVANNIWLQAILDGGVLLAVIQGSLIVLVFKRLFLRVPKSTRILSAAWLSLILISGMIGSDFFTPARWVLLGFACLALRAEFPDSSDGRFLLRTDLHGGFYVPGSRSRARTGVLET